MVDHSAKLLYSVPVYSKDIQSSAHDRILQMRENTK